MDIKIQQPIPDEHMLRMARFLKVGIDSLQLGFKQLTANRVCAKESALVARNAANDTKIAFTRALADIILTEEHAQRLTSSDEGVNDRITTVCAANLRRRMIYSQLSKTADRVSWASAQLCGLSAKHH